MRIQHNIMAMNAYRNFVGNNNALGKNLEKLSSGYRINRAGDDAAGLAISEKMRAQISGLDAAQKNVKDGISLVKTAEGAMQEVQDMLNRMKYLATQSANGTYQDAVDRENLQKEADALMDEINRIADSANFNGQKLLNGELDASADLGTKGAFSASGADGAVELLKEGDVLGANTVVHKGGVGSAGSKFTVNLHNLEYNGAAHSALKMTIGNDVFTLDHADAATYLGADQKMDAKEIAQAFAAGAFKNADGSAMTAGQATINGGNFNITAMNGTLVFQQLATDNKPVNGNMAVKFEAVAGSVGGGGTSYGPYIHEGHAPDLTAANDAILASSGGTLTDPETATKIDNATTEGAGYITETVTLKAAESPDYAAEKGTVAIAEGTDNENLTVANNSTTGLDADAIKTAAGENVGEIIVKTFTDTDDSDKVKLGLYVKSGETETLIGKSATEYTSAGSGSAVEYEFNSVADGNASLGKIDVTITDSQTVEADAFNTAGVTTGLVLEAGDPAVTGTVSGAEGADANLAAAIKGVEGWTAGDVKLQHVAEGDKWQLTDGTKTLEVTATFADGKMTISADDKELLVVTGESTTTEDEFEAAFGTATKVGTYTAAGAATAEATIAKGTAIENVLAGMGVESEDAVDVQLQYVAGEGETAGKWQVKVGEETADLTAAFEGNTLTLTAKDAQGEDLGTVFTLTGGTEDTEAEIQSLFGTAKNTGFTWKPDAAVEDDTTTDGTDTEKPPVATTVGDVKADKAAVVLKESATTATTITIGGTAGDDATIANAASGGLNVNAITTAKNAIAPGANGDVTLKVVTGGEDKDKLGLYVGDTLIGVSAETIDKYASAGGGATADIEIFQLAENSADDVSVIAAGNTSLGKVTITNNKATGALTATDVNGTITTGVNYADGQTGAVTADTDAIKAKLDEMGADDGELTIAKGATAGNYDLMIGDKKIASAALDTTAGTLTFEDGNGTELVKVTGLNNQNDLDDAIDAETNKTLGTGVTYTAPQISKGDLGNAVKGDYNTATTVITTGDAQAKERLASTAFDLTKDMLVDGGTITIGKETYTIGGKDADVQIDDLDLTTEAGLTMAAERLTQAAAGNKTWSVGHKGGEMTFTQVVDKKTGKANSEMELNTVADIEKSFAFAGASKKGAGLTLQIGDTAESYNQLKVAINDMHTKALGLDDIDISNLDSAKKAIETITNAINTVSSTRGDLGAVQNRLEHTTNNLSVMEENIQDAESTIRDTDMADEMTTYTKNNILIQAAQAMLAQANQQPQGVLQLLQ